MEWINFEQYPPPKDGAYYLGCNATGDLFIFAFVFGDWHERTVYGEIANEIIPKYWIPLPELPKEIKDET